ncbi:MAG: DUF58 domain-containing protein [Oscillospiraceae bacterium]|nr:DUF58 domain-containing protein [Oscillospiraceae bacterium]
MWKNRIIYIVLLIVMLAFFRWYTGWISWYALLVTVFFPLLSLAVSLRRMLLSRAALTVPKRGERGESFRIYAALGREDVRGKVTVEIRDIMSGRTKKLRAVFPSDVPTVEYTPLHAGKYQVEIKRARAYDMLGLFSIPLKKPGQESFTVMPTAKKPKSPPDLSGLHTAVWRPAGGSAFSENHEVREYVPGDPIRSIHWKLSAKTDRPMVREPMEQARKKVTVSFDLFEDRDKTDSVLAQVMWLSGKLTELDVPHELRYAAWDGETVTAPVESKQQLEEQIIKVLSSPVTADREINVTAGQRHFHIVPESGETGV